MSFKTGRTPASGYLALGVLYPDDVPFLLVINDVVGHRAVQCRHPFPVRGTLHLVSSEPPAQESAHKQCNKTTPKHHDVHLL